jgi:hypothetical protein
LTSFSESIPYQFGLVGEKEIVRILQQYGAYVIPQYNYAEDDEFKGPRMHGGEDELILPDLDVCRQGSRIWVEVKTKSDMNLHRISGDYVHGFNRKHYAHYLNVEQASGNEVWVIFIERLRGEHRCGKLSEIPIHHTYNGDKMGRHGMVFFNVDHLLPLDILFARLGVPQ